MIEWFIAGVFLIRWSRLVDYLVFHFLGRCY